MKVATTSLCLALALPAVAQAQEELVHQAFVQAYGRSPAISASSALVRSPETDAAIAAGRRAVAAPTDRALQAEFTERLGDVLASHGATSSNILEALFLVLRESIAEMQEDKKYYLEKLDTMNRMGEALSDYLEELADASRRLGGIERGTSGRSTRTVSITVRTFDPVWVGSLAGTSGDDVSFVCDPCLTTREATLNAEQIQREQESVLGVQRRLEAALQEVQMRHAELELRTDAVVRMLAEVLRTADGQRAGGVP